MTRALLGTAPAGTTNAVRWEDVLAQNTATLPTNGWYLPSANTLGVATNGVHRGTISSVGEWMINASTAAVNTGSVSLSAAGSQGNWAGAYYGSSVTGKSNGMYIAAGTNASDQCFTCYNQAYGGLFQVLGNGAITAYGSLTVAGAVTLSSSISVAAPIVRSQTTGGYLSGNFNSVETVGTTAGMIYSIGPGYAGAGSGNYPLYAVNGLYGVGYTYSTCPNGSSGSATIATTTLSPANWGLYVASGGKASIFLNSDNGGGYFTGPLSSTSANFSQNVVIAAPSSGSALAINSSAYAWGNNITALDIGGGALASYNGAQEVRIDSNLYFDGTNWRYKASGLGTDFDSSGGGFTWSTAPSGSAGAVATLSPVMTLSNAGDLAIKGKWGCNGAIVQPASAGWGTPTGLIAPPANFSATAATIAQTNQAIAWIIALLKNVGIFTT